MTISVRFLSVVRALRSFLERLLRIGLGLLDMMSFSTALMKASRAASLPLGGAHVPLHLKRFLTSSDGLVELVWLFWKNSFSRKRLINLTKELSFYAGRNLYIILLLSLRNI